MPVRVPTSNRGKTNMSNASNLLRSDVMGTLDPYNRTTHGAWSFVRRGILPAGEVGEALAADLDAITGDIIAGLGGDALLTVEDRVELEQFRSARGARLLLEAWTATKGSYCTRGMVGCHGPSVRTGTRSRSWNASW